MYGGASGQGWLGLAAFLVVCGLVIGLALISSDLVNPITSWAESQRYQVETQQLNERDAIDTAQYKAISEAQTQAEILKLREEVAHQEQVHQAELQRLYAEQVQQEQLQQEQARQAKAWAALKLRLVEMSTIILLSGFAISLVVLSIGYSRQLGRARPDRPPWIQASLRLHPQTPPKLPQEHVDRRRRNAPTGSRRTENVGHSSDVYESAKEVAIG